jgi:hypothetical protein
VPFNKGILLDTVIFSGRFPAICVVTLIDFLLRIKSIFTFSPTRFKPIVVRNVLELSIFLALSSLQIGKFPFAYRGLKITPDFQRMKIL